MVLPAMTLNTSYCTAIRDKDYTMIVEYLVAEYLGQQGLNLVGFSIPQKVQGHLLIYFCVGPGVSTAGTTRAFRWAATGCSQDSGRRVEGLGCKASLLGLKNSDFQGLRCSPKAPTKSPISGPPVT